ncbi:hypothetical protein M0657_010185 [Pyricularia oryzae]|nr:hypothetical protein M0657_010185 [Pyricularia oryzae]
MSLDVLFTEKASLVLCDLNSAQICVNDNPQHDLPLVPENHRPLELVILDMLWSYPVDMWCLGITVWRMLDTKSFFSHYAGAGEDLDEARHSSLMVGLLGPPPREFLQNSKGSLKYWDENGKWNGLNPVSGLYPQSSLLGSRDPSLPRRSMASSLGTQDLDPGQTRAA